MYRTTVGLGVSDAGQDQHACLGRHAKELAQEVEAAFTAYIKVKQNNVGLLLFGNRKSVNAGARLADDRQSLMVLDEHSESRAHNDVIIYDYDSNWLLWNRHILIY